MSHNSTDAILHINFLSARKKYHVVDINGEDNHADVCTDQSFCRTQNSNISTPPMNSSVTPQDLFGDRVETSISLSKLLLIDVEAWSF